MKTKTAIYSLFLTGIMLPILLNCKKEAIKTVPTVTVAAVTNITANSASSGGDITSDGGATVTTRGVCWSNSLSPTTSDSKTSNGSGTGSFTSPITGLTPGVNYTLKAYATNAVGTSYSSSTSFATLALASTLTTSALSGITSTSAVGGGNITNDGGAPVTARGVCWSTNQNPVITDNKTSDAIGSGSFISNITGLTPGATYYVRAYATNSVSTAYGNQLTLITLAALPTLTTSIVLNITSISASSGGNITSDGGGTITVRGVCWSTTTDPTIASNKTSDNSGSGIFASSLIGLTAGTKYYVRAYATNSAGTAYGNEISFSTLTQPTIINTTKVSDEMATTATSGGNIISAGGTIIARGVCWSINSNPTIIDDKTVDGTGTGIFISKLTNLKPYTTYKLRAYATTNAGTTYGEEVLFGTHYTKISDIDGNYYDIVKIGDQIWMANDLKVTKLRDGSRITKSLDDYTWINSTNPLYCYYGDDDFESVIGAALYNYYTVSTGQLCPSGWRVANGFDFDILVTYLGGIDVAGGKLKANYGWSSPNNLLSPRSYFDALPRGYRLAAYSGVFNEFSTVTYYWLGGNNSTSSTTGAMQIRSQNTSVYFGTYNKNRGFSVRCIYNQ